MLKNMNNIETLNYLNTIGTLSDRVTFRRKYSESFAKALKDLIDYIKQHDDIHDIILKQLLSTFANMFDEAIKATAREEAAYFNSEEIRRTEAIKAQSITFDNIVPKR